MTPRRLLEVGAMPFPSPQGTQALVREQCEALARRGHEVHLLVYAHGDRAYGGRGVTVHRLADWPRERSLRSGPTVGKLVLDARLACEVRRLEARLRPDFVHAHNYEALAACLAARPRAPLIYHAHTLLAGELPTFARGAVPRGAAHLAGALADRLLPPGAAATVAVSPRLAAELARLGHPRSRLHAVPPGIELPGPAPDGRRERERLGLVGSEVVCYCGNLDRYQGLASLLEAVSRLAPTRPRLALLVVTASETTTLVAEARALGVEDRLRLRAHGTSHAAAVEAIAAADVAAVPRSTAGGIPVKLLSYLAAARPVVVTEAGAAGLDLGEAAVVVPDRDPSALAAAMASLLDDGEEARRRGRAGRRLVESLFTWDRSCGALEAALEAVLERRSRV